MHASASPTTSSAQSGSAPSRGGRFRWRIVDIVVASVLGVASGVIFWIWNTASVGPSALLTSLLPGLQGLLDGPWLFAGVLGALVIRKPGAAIYTELLAAVLSALVGNQWGGWSTILAGLWQGLGAEVAFLLLAYKLWSLPVALLAGAGAAIAGAVNNLVVWYVGSGPEFIAIYLISAVISGIVIAGLGAWLITRGLAATGALDRFASGRSRRELV